MEYRNSCKYQHRVIGQFLAIQAWLKGVDCLVIDRYELEVLLGVSRFKNERIEWLKEDLKGWFSEIYDFHNEKSFHSLFISRAPISKFMVNSATTDERINQLSANGVNAIKFSSGSHCLDKLYYGDIVKYLAVLNSGLYDPRDLSEKLP